MLKITWDAVVARNEIANAFFQDCLSTTFSSMNKRIKAVSTKPILSRTRIYPSMIRAIAVARCHETPFHMAETLVGRPIPRINDWIKTIIAIDNMKDEHTKGKKPDPGCLRLPSPSLLEPYMKYRANRTQNTPLI